MYFTELLHQTPPDPQELPYSSEEHKENEERTIDEQTELPQDILRSIGYKLKLVTTLKFGVQIDFFGKLSPSDITKITKSLNDKNYTRIEIESDSIFVSKKL